MKIFRVLPVMVLILFALSFPLFAFDATPSPGWDNVLDTMQDYTWRGPDELDSELKKQETRIGQGLAGYIEAWEESMASPVEYTETAPAENRCSPSAYCDFDFIDAGSLISKLRDKNNRMGRFLFERFSSEAREMINDTRDAVPAKSVQLLAGEMTRVVREETVYHPERFAAIQLSPAAISLLTEQDTPQNRVCINKTLLAEAFPGELATNFKCVIRKDYVYRRLVAANTAQYLRTGDKELLRQAITLSETFADKIFYPDFAFWYYYPRALASIEFADRDALLSSAYGIINDVILRETTSDEAASAAGDKARRAYSLNLEDLVITRAITAAKMEGLEALGPAVWLPGNRDSSEIPPQFAGLRQYLSGPESDNYRLNYAVAMREGMQRRALLAGEIHEKQNGSADEEIFEESLAYLQLAGKWAFTGKGKAAALTGYLELVNARPEKIQIMLREAGSSSSGSMAGGNRFAQAAELFGAMAAKGNGGWRTLGYANRNEYIRAAHGLWNALRRNSLLVADYYLKKMDGDDFQSTMNNSEQAQRALNGYMELFDRYTADGHRDIIPDSAYFSYAESLRRMSRLKRAVHGFSSNRELHKQAVDCLLQAIALYPCAEAVKEYREISTGADSFRARAAVAPAAVIPDDATAELHRMDNHPMHSTIKSAFYAKRR